MLNTKYLEERREALLLTQKEVTILAKIHASTYTQILATGRASYSTIKALIDALDLDKEQFVISNDA